MARPLVDLQIRFTRFPNKQPHAFPGAEWLYLPIVRLAIIHGTRSMEVPALIDTGASYTLLGTEHARALGINLEGVPTVPIIGLGKAGIIGHVHQLRLLLPDAAYGWDTRVVFCAEVDSFPHVLLGQFGFLEHFEVRFKARQRTVRIFL